MVTRISRNIAIVELKGKHIQYALLSDLHWDNPKCDRVQLKRHLDYCLENDIKILLNGDTFCLMMGRFDPRRSKKDIRPEHNKANYLDVVIEDAVEWFAPYAHLITVVGYGNHETAILKNLETDPIQRFVDLLNFKCKSNVITGGYGGWIILKIKISNSDSKETSVKIKYNHGSGGGGPVTRGAINLTRSLEMIESMDVYTMGHIHENNAANVSREYLYTTAGQYEIKLKDIHMAITGTYKEEYDDGFGGYHIEKGRPPKTIGGRILNVYIEHRMTKNVRKITKVIDTCRFPL